MSNGNVNLPEFLDKRALWEKATAELYTRDFYKEAKQRQELRDSYNRAGFGASEEELEKVIEAVRMPEDKNENYLFVDIMANKQKMDRLSVKVPQQKPKEEKITLANIIAAIFVYSVFFYAVISVFSEYIGR